MSELDPKIAELEVRLDSLVRTQVDFQREITTIRRELTKLRGVSNVGQPSPYATRPLTDPPMKPPQNVPPGRKPPPAQWDVGEPKRAFPPSTFGTNPPPQSGGSAVRSDSLFSNYVSSYSGYARADLEKFIGENLISKIGIIILILGVGIGAKYAIDNGWINPLMRIVFGYFMGFGLLGLAAKLKEKYLNFSAVLLSGGMAIMYFVTYFAYAYYSLMPQPAAFILMAMFTAFTVAAAIFYDRQVIAHFGLVGAYAVPFLLSNNSGNYLFLFSYTAVLNTAILAISVKKYWKSLYYSAFAFTWLIYGAWFFNKYDSNEHLYLAAIFASVFFLIFYLISLVYRLITEKIGHFENTGFLLTNSFVFYGFGYAILESREELRSLQGLFTAGHALLHSFIAQLFTRFKASAVDVVQVLAILIITFSTIAIPVQFDGNTVTLIWAVEAAALFWFGRVRTLPLFEYFSYPIMVMAVGSFFLDWVSLYAERTSVVSELNRQPIANGDFITAIVFIAAFSFIYVTNRDERNDVAIDTNLIRPFGLIVGAIGLFALYNALRIEISNHFHLQLVGNTAHQLSSLLEPTLMRRVDDIARFNILWQLNYTMFFLIAVCVVNLRKVRSAILAFAGVGLSALVLFLFSTFAMYLFYELRVGYMLVAAADETPAGSINIAIRYISYVFAGALIYSIYGYSKNKLLTKFTTEYISSLGFDAIFSSNVFIAASCELVNLMAQFHLADADKLGLSILWGLYSLGLIVIGIAWNKKHLRIAAFALLAVTLVKLFLYDVADLPTIPKTILFVSLGVLLLIVSFLYNKYKNLIFQPVDENAE